MNHAGVLKVDETLRWAKYRAGQDWTGEGFMAGKKSIIASRLRSLKDIPDVSVTESDEGNTLKVGHKATHALDFTFRWLTNDHFVGYFVDSDGNQSQAVIALRSGLDAINFAAGYVMLVRLRAKVKS